VKSGALGKALGLGLDPAQTLTLESGETFFIFHFSFCISVEGIQCERKRLVSLSANLQIPRKWIEAFRGQRRQNRFPIFN
jgi:hypothetical protein